MTIEKGFYWAKTHGSEWYDYIAEVYGEKPFLGIKVWDRRNDAIIWNKTADSLVFGPRIEEQEVKQR